MTQPAMLAAFKRISSGRTRQELDHRRSTLANLVAIFIRTKYEAGIALRFGSIGIKTNLESVLSIQRSNLQLNVSLGSHAFRFNSVDPSVPLVTIALHICASNNSLCLALRWSGVMSPYVSDTGVA